MPCLRPLSLPVALASVLAIPRGACRARQVMWIEWRAGQLAAAVTAPFQDFAITTSLRKAPPSWPGGPHTPQYTRTIQAHLTPPTHTTQRTPTCADHAPVELVARYPAIAI